MKYSTNFDYRQLSTKEIIVDEKGQRDVNHRSAQFNKIMKTFNPLLVNDVKVVYVGGKYYCWDGQMTMKVLKARNGGNDCTVRCKVFYDQTLLDAANLFVAQNGTVFNVSTVDKLRVKYNYGDPDVSSFVRMTEMNGISIDWGNSKGRNKVVAVSNLYQIFNSFEDTSEYSQFLSILRDTWGGCPDSFRREIMSGLYLFMTTYRGKYDVKRLRAKLAETTPTVIIRDARVSAAPGARKYAYQIYNAYNKSTVKYRLPDLL